VTNPGTVFTRARRAPTNHLVVALLAGFCLSRPAAASITGTTWSPIGPAPIGNLFGGVTGRASAIVVNPLNGDQIWLGTASGGVWFSDNAGQNWVPLSDHTEALTVGAIAVSQCTAAGCGRIYVGTGENAIRRDTLHGRGLLIGTEMEGPPQPLYSWSLVDGSASQLDFNLGSIFNIILIPGASAGTDGLFITLSSGVTASSSESTVTAPEPASGYGIYRSTNGGATWTKVTVPNTNGARPTDLEIDPLDTSKMWAAFLGVGIFRSTNGGASWCAVTEGIGNPITCPATSGLPDDPSEEFDFVEMTVHHADSELEPIVYASLGHCNRFIEFFNGELLHRCTPSVYRSTDSGVNWTLRRAGTNEGGAYADCVVGYSYYTHLLEADPVDPDALFMGGVRLCRSINGGQNFFPADYNLTPGIIPYKNLVPDPVIHADHHDLAFHPQDPHRLYSTSDGGFAVTDGYNLLAFLAWVHGKKDLQLTGFQSIDKSPASKALIGGAQDNGGMRWTGNDQWEYLGCCGDGGFARADVSDPNTLYFTANPVASGSNVSRTINGSSFCAVDKGVDSSEPAAFYAPIEQSTVSPYYLYRAGTRVYRSRVVGPTNEPCKDLEWDEISWPFSFTDYPQIVFGKNVVNAIGLGASNPERIYVGLYGGEVWTTASVSTDPFQWVWQDRTVGLPVAPVTRIAVDPTDELTAYVAFSGFSIDPKVWKTTDAGLTWNPAAGGLPAGVPVNTVHIEPGSPNVLWTGLDGNPGGNTIYRSIDSGVSWSPVSSGLPNVPVYEIVLDPSHNRAYAGTHGRGAWVFGMSLLLPKEYWRARVPFEIPIICDPLLPLQACTVELQLPDGTTCAAGSRDARGATIHTDANGRLVTSLAGVWADKPVAWGCFGGQCVGGVAAAECSPAGEPIASVRVTCGGESVSENLAGVQTLQHLPSTDFSFQVPVDPGAGVVGTIDGVPDARLLGTTVGDVFSTTAGRFDMSATLQSGDGTTRSLCSVGVGFGPGETDAQVLQRAADALNASPSCAAAGVTAVLEDNPGGREEDDFGRAPSVRLEELPLAGTQLITAVHTAPGEATGACFAVDALGVPMLAQGQTLALHFETVPAGAAGGEITLLQETDLGACTIVLQTAAGETADEVALSLVTLADGTPRAPSDCPEKRKLRNLRVDGPVVEIAMASGIKVCIGDAGLGLSIRPVELTNLHPAAVLAIPPGVECTGPAGAMVLLDGSGSTDPDSSPGTNDDIVRFDWFENFGLAGETFLGSGALLPRTLPLGTHAITLRVTDGQGLESLATTALDVVDITPPSLSVGADRAILWPPNHRLVDVATQASAADLCGPTVVTLQAAVSDEADDLPGPDDGETTGDVQGALPGAPDFDLSLRAESHRTGGGRTYTVQYSARDASGNETVGVIPVSVPVEIGGVSEPLILTVDLAPSGAGPPGAVISWSAVPGALHYNVIAADLGGVNETADAIDLGVVVCIEAHSLDTTTAGFADTVIPAVGTARIYLAEYDDGRRVSYGTETARKPRRASSGDCP